MGTHFRTSFFKVLLRNLTVFLLYFPASLVPKDWDINYVADCLGQQSGQKAFNNAADIENYAQYLNGILPSTVSKPHSKW